MTFPALAALRARYPHARIEYAGNAVAAELALARGLIDRVHSQHEARWSGLYSAGPLPTAFRDWLASFDVVVNFWPDPDSSLSRHFPTQPRQTYLTAAAMPDTAPAAAHYCRALGPIGVETTRYWHRLLPRNARATPPARATIAIHPGSGSARKNWPVERWSEVIHLISEPVVLFVGEAEAGCWTEAELQRPFAARLRDGSLRVRVNAPLESLVDELNACAFFLGHDSGVSHLAAACGTPSLLLFGPTDQSMWAPPAPHVRVLKRGESLDSISVQDVMTALAAR